MRKCVRDFSVGLTNRISHMGGVTNAEETEGLTVGRKTGRLAEDL